MSNLALVYLPQQAFALHRFICHLSKTQMIDRSRDPWETAAVHPLCLRVYRPWETPQHGKSLGKITKLPSSSCPTPENRTKSPKKCKRNTENASLCNYLVFSPIGGGGAREGNFVVFLIFSGFSMSGGSLGLWRESGIPKPCSRRSYGVSVLCLLQ